MRQSTPATLTIEEARKVTWLRSNPKPLGQLLDEGYLTPSRLKWAGENAYNSRLRQAARVLLEATSLNTTTQPKVSDSPSHEPSSVTLPVTYDQARTALWPFRPYRGEAIGKLVDSQLLSLRDLAYAIENAYDVRVRQAATTMLLLRLQQRVEEPQDHGFVTVVSSGRSFSENRQLLYTLIQGFVLGFLLALAIVFASMWIVDSVRRGANSASNINEASLPVLFAVGVLFVIAGVIVRLMMIGINRLLQHFDTLITQHRLGQEGEDRVIGIVQQALDGRWHVFRNIRLPGKPRGDLDLVLVGPAGILVVEVKNYHGIYRNNGSDWEIQRKGTWGKMRVSPSQQAKNGAARLGNFLKADGIQAWVTPVVVWANPESNLRLENPMVAVWTLDRLPDELGNLWEEGKLSEHVRTQIVEKLTRLCEHERELQQNL